VPGADETIAETSPSLLPGDIGTLAAAEANPPEEMPEAARRSLVFVDRRESAFHGVGDILQPIASGAIAESDVRGDLYDLAPGKIAGRSSADDITFFKNAGGGHLDLMTAEVIYTRATAQAAAAG